MTDLEVTAMTTTARRCPYLVPVTADHMWMYPVSAYCRRPDGDIRVPSAKTLEQVCSTSAYVECLGFLATVPQDARCDGC
ncbi:MAG TPA: hypothetical protein VMI34_00015 [Candidatus Bathyarchaeia archaeon]|nr:hypothetical protein [Candidatus Bathyarchaeia archaeon]